MAENNGNSGGFCLIIIVLFIILALMCERMDNIEFRLNKQEKSGTATVQVN